MKYHRLSRYKIKRIIFCFAEDITASSASKILHINRNTINAYYNEIREKILQHSLKEQEKELGEFELDESYFGARRVRGKRGRGAAGKTPVFGLLKRNGKVFVTVVPNCSREELMPIIQGKILEGSTIQKAYDGLILNGYNHYRVFHSENEFARGKSHVNGIECFWSYAKFHKIQWTNRCKIYLAFLKETECRFNHKNDNFASFIERIFWGKL